MLKINFFLTFFYLLPDFEQNPYQFIISSPPLFSHPITISSFITAQFPTGSILHRQNSHINRSLTANNRHDATTRVVSTMSDRIWRTVVRNHRRTRADSLSRPVRVWLTRTEHVETCWRLLPRDCLIRQRDFASFQIRELLLLSISWNYPTNLFMTGYYVARRNSRWRTTLGLMFRKKKRKSNNNKSLNGKMA